MIFALIYFAIGMIVYCVLKHEDKTPLACVEWEIILLGVFLAVFFWPLLLIVIFSDRIFKV